MKRVDKRNKCRKDIKEEKCEKARRGEGWVKTEIYRNRAFISCRHSHTNVLGLYTGPAMGPCPRKVYSKFAPFPLSTMQN